MDLVTQVFEKIKLACSKECGTFHSYEGTPEHMACLELEKMGLIRLYDGGGGSSHKLWVLDD